MARRLSPSAVELHGECPCAFRFRYVDHVSAQREPSPLLMQGNALHRALAFLYRLPRAERTLEGAEHVVEWAWRQERRLPRNRDAFTHKDEAERYWEESRDMMLRFASNFDLLASPLALEQQLTVATQNGLQLRGRIDRVDKLGDDLGLHIIDYKSGRTKIDPDELKHEAAVQFYVLAAEKQYRLPVERVSYLYLRDATSVAWEPEREDVETLAERLVAKLDLIQEDKTHPPRPGVRCDWCEFARICPATKQVTLAQLPLTQLTGR